MATRKKASEVINNSSANWRRLLDTLEGPLRDYLRESKGKPISNAFPCAVACRVKGCRRGEQYMSLLFWDHYEDVRIVFCHCNPLCRALVRAGMFPTTPSEPSVAISMALLDFIHKSFQAGTSVAAGGKTLKAFYEHRGMPDTSTIDGGDLDPFTKGFKAAYKWYSVLREKMDPTYRLQYDAIDKTPRNGLLLFIKGHLLLSLTEAAGSIEATESGEATGSGVLEIDLVRFPWQTMPSLLAKYNLFIEGWPEGVPFPGQGDKTKTIEKLLKDQLRDLAGDEEIPHAARCSTST
ncbi:hypothetical protein CERSUDRAFT_121628 [Gelatoporia subvermispora B]|uniref:CxC1-like cysteine cluster associated with KDZ transposases domain-containing protein n=1 Tax=Ceriporiopsis subvermispora (strain B) TaxID=914234 RepID=M2PW65_CERS8|nr:hypothetical protein CERSUDRAFT_121628 [Gelatoporia subvermispora B]